MTAPVMSVQVAEAQARTWLLRGVALLLAHPLVFIVAHDTWEDFGVLLTAGAWWCLAERTDLRGYVKGWKANDRVRADR